jgi:hypothetical protein
LTVIMMAWAAIWRMSAWLNGVSSVEGLHE